MYGVAYGKYGLSSAGNAGASQNAAGAAAATGSNGSTTAAAMLKDLQSQWAASKAQDKEKSLTVTRNAITPVFSCRELEVCRLS
jgi:hypothetical protein